MGFGSYDESEQEQDDDEPKDLGADMTEQIRNWRTKGDGFDGEESTELGDEEKLFERI